MTEVTKHRIIGIAVLVALIVLISPLLNNHSDPARKLDEDFSIPAAPARPEASPIQLNMNQDAPLAPTQDFNPKPIARVNLDKPIESSRHVLINPEPKTTSNELSKKPVTEKLAAKINLEEPKTMQPSPSLSKTNTENPNPAPQQVKQTKPKAIVTNGWIVQLASFSNRSNAETLKRKLNSKGFTAYLSSAKNSKGLEITRLLVGPEKDRPTAENLAKRLQQSVKMKGIVLSQSIKG